MLKVAFIAVLVCLNSFSFAQTNLEKDHKVGLVLSGGGAKGFAHIGALKAIDEVGIRVDYIGGTSMGAVVGSLYAAGYSALAIEEIMKDLKFRDLVQKEISRKSKPFYQKENDHKYILRLSLENNKIKLPSGLTDGQEVLNYLSQYTQHVNTITDFSELPIPFVCIATDLENGEQVLLNKGYLPDAIRASASFPTLLEPMELDGKMLVDGGIVNNFPVDEVLAMGADLIIGVDVGDGKLLKKEDINSLIDVLNQVVSYQMLEEADLAKKDKTTVYIRPDISPYSVVSFDKFDEIVQLGYETTLAQINEINKIADLQTTSKIISDPSLIPEEFIVNSIRVVGNRHYTYGYIIEKLQIQLGEKISFDKLFKGIDRLSATNNFTNIQNKVFLAPDGNSCNIVFNVKESPVDTFVQLGLHHDDLYKTGVLLNLTRKHLFFDNDFVSADFVVGQKPRYNITYFVDNGIHLSIGLNSSLQNFDFDTDFENSNTTFDPEINFTNLDYFEISNRLFLQAVYQDNFAVGIGMHHKFLNIFSRNKLDTQGGDNTTHENSNYLNACSFLKYDTFDALTFPKKGLFFEAYASWHLISSNDLQNNFNPFLQGTLKFGHAYTFGKKFTTQFDSEAGVSFSENKNPYLDFHLGGYNSNFSRNFTSFHGYPFASIGNNSYLKSTLSLRYEVFHNHFISGITNFSRVENNIFANGALFDSTKSGYALQYGLKTIAGPISLTYSYSPEIKENFWNVNFGYWF